MASHSLESYVLRLQKNEVQEALTRAELAKAELELEINRLRIEDLTLRDNLLKLQALNEQLIHEKQDLQKTLDSFEAGIINATIKRLYWKTYIFYPNEKCLYKSTPQQIFVKLSIIKSVLPIKIICMVR